MRNGLWGQPGASVSITCWSSPAGTLSGCYRSSSSTIPWQAQGELRVARWLQERALTIREKVLGPDHPDTANINNLAVLLWNQGELAAAQSLHERALVIKELVLGPDHPDTAASLHNLAA